jgi:putative nucleotidyltransferase with HDIG domain
MGEDRERGRGLRSLLRQDGHAVAWLKSIHRWRETERQVLPEVVIATVRSTDTVLRIPGRPLRGFPAPVLFVQHETDLFRELHDEERLVDRLQSPFTAEEFLARVDALARLRRVVLRGRPRDGDAGRRRDAVVARRRWLTDVGSRLTGLLGTRVPRYARPTMPYLEVVARVAEWADRRDMFEPGHAERVTSFAAMIADGLGIPDDEASTVLRAAMLHDIGKVALPSEVLRLRGPLADEQMRLIRTHPERGADLLCALDPDEEVAKAIRYHHERVDGSGYYGKSRVDTPRAAQILAVVENYDAMTTSQVREPVSSERALGVLKEKRGSYFDDDCVNTLVDALRPRPTHIPLSGSGILPPK